MVVLQQKYATNFQLAEGKNHNMGSGQERYFMIEDTLNGNNSILSETQSMNLLKRVSQRWNGVWGTKWSLVFNLNTLSMDMCINMDYEKVYSYSLVDK